MDVSISPAEAREPQGGPILYGGSSGMDSSGQDASAGKSAGSSGSLSFDFEKGDPRTPENIYTNLIITEHVLRSQYVELQRSRRRGLVFFWAVIAGAIVLTYRVWFEDSPYRFIRSSQQLLMVALYISIGLFFLTGMYTKVFSVAPRFISDTNKGLKHLNIRLVKTNTTMKEKLVRVLVNPIYSDQPAGPVKLVLLPRAFPPYFIEEWELFRDEYWEKQRRRRNRSKKTRKRKTSC